MILTAWAPCLELGHSKSREKVANAEERAERTQARRKMLGFLRKLAFLQHPASSMSKPQAICKHTEYLQEEAF